VREEGAWQKEPHVTSHQALDQDSFASISGQMTEFAMFAIISSGVFSEHVNLFIVWATAG